MQRFGGLFIRMLPNILGLFDKVPTVFQQPVRLTDCNGAQGEACNLMTLPLNPRVLFEAAVDRTRLRLSAHRLWLRPLLTPLPLSPH